MRGGTNFKGSDASGPSVYLLILCLGYSTGQDINLIKSIFQVDHVMRVTTKSGRLTIVGEVTAAFSVKDWSLNDERETQRATMAIIMTDR